MGIARSALERDPETHIVAVEPEGSVYGELLGKVRAEAEYKTEGIGTHDTATNELFEPELVDAVDAVSDRAAHAELKTARPRGGPSGRLECGCRERGVETGRRTDRRRRAGRSPRDGRHDLPDSSERYLSKGIYRSFEEWTS